MRLGLEWKYAATPLLSPAKLARCEKIAKSAFNHPERVRATGATRLVAAFQE